MSIVNLSPEQGDYLATLEEVAKNIPEGRFPVELIPALRGHVAKAQDMGLPEIAYFGLEVYVRLFDREMALPAHLRNSRIVGEENV